jgi:hypothetical protein
MSMKAWLRETHGKVFELFRHFLRRFFDSDRITATEHTPAALFGGLSVVLQWMFLFIQPLKVKYEELSRLPAPGLYREALRADELWLITLTMAAIGLLTAIKWNALFPSLRDYRSLASLPLRPWQVFAAKLLALMTAASAAVLAINFLPAFGFPAVSGGQWAPALSLGRRGLANFAASSAGGFFLFFASIALEGLLLNLLSPRRFGRVAGAFQGLLVAAMLILLVFSFSIQPGTATMLLEPRAARWLPPIWFLGLHQWLTGDPDPSMLILAHRGLAALGIAAALTLALYALSYRRHRTLLIEATSNGARPRRSGRILEWLLPNPRQQAVASFLGKTFARSESHRTILAAYLGFGFAVLLTSCMGIGKLFPAERLNTAYLVYSHVIFLVFLLLGLRHTFSLPAEPGANWTFRIVEKQGRQDWMLALDRLVLFGAAVVLLAVPLPFELKLLGWRTIPEMLLFAALAMPCYEFAFGSWEKLPFTCSYLPGKTPAWIVALELFGLLIALPAISGAMVVCLYNPWAFMPVLAVFGAFGLHLRRQRMRTWGRSPLRYEELPEPVIHGLSLLR